MIVPLVVTPTVGGSSSSISMSNTRQALAAEERLATDERHMLDVRDELGEIVEESIVVHFRERRQVLAIRHGWLTRNRRCT